ALDRLVLEDRLDDDVVAGGAIGSLGGGDAAEQDVRGRLLQLSLVDLALQVRADSGPPLLRKVGGAIGEGDLLAGSGADLGDAVAHQPRADDEDAFDAHRWGSVPATVATRLPMPAAS